MNTCTCPTAMLDGGGRLTVSDPDDVDATCHAHANVPLSHGTCGREGCDLPTVNDDVCWSCRCVDASTYIDR